MTGDYTLEPHDGLTDDYPTRCIDCARPIHKYARFPSDRCIGCHEAVSTPPTNADELARLWGKEDAS